MLCTNCRMTRAENEAPCQHCGAPSSLLKISTDGSWGNNASNAAGGSWDQANASQMDSFWGAGGSGNGSGVAWNNENSFSGLWNSGNPTGGADMGASVPQLAFDNAPGNPSAYSGSWSTADQAGPGRRAPTGNLQESTGQSMLPAIYQGGAMVTQGEGRRNTTTLQLLPDQMAEQLLPALPGQPVEQMTYVPPMYTQPRPLIPKYRAISGLVSIIIVALLICGGAGYLAQATGKFAAIQQLLAGSKPLPNLKPTNTVKIPNPSNAVDYGPAANVITSATLTSQIDPTGKFAVTPGNDFHPKQFFYLLFTIQMQNQSGTITTQWYTNQLLFTSINKQVKKEDFQGHPLTGTIKMAYDQAASGIVEIYWNNQLAQRLYFAVR